MGCNMGCDINCGLSGLLLWLIFDGLLSIEGEVDITNIRWESVDLCATFFGDEIGESDTSFANVIPPAGEALKTMGRDVESLCNSGLGRILLGRPEDESQG